MGAQRFRPTGCQLPEKSPQFPNRLAAEIHARHGAVRLSPCEFVVASPTFARAYRLGLRDAIGNGLLNTGHLFANCADDFGLRRSRGCGTAFKARTCPRAAKQLSTSAAPPYSFLWASGRNSSRATLPSLA